MSKFSSLLSQIYREYDESSSDTDAVARVKDWVNDVVADLQSRSDISGLQVQGHQDYTSAETSNTLTITSAHNTHSVLTRIDKAYAEEFSYSSGWVTTGTKYNLRQIAYSEYLEKMIESDDVGTPECFALALPDSNGQPTCYLYPPPDSDDTEGDDGKRWRFHFFGEARIGILEQDADVVYPVGCDYVVLAGVASKQCAYDKDYTGYQIHYGMFQKLLKEFRARDHMHGSMYCFGRGKQAAKSGININEPIVGP